MLGVTSAVRLTAATTGFAVGFARGVVEQIGELAQLTLGGGRRIWTGPGRTHIEYGSVEPAVQDDFLRELEARLRSHPHVTDVTFIPETGRVVIHHDQPLRSAELADLLGPVEEQFDAARQPERAAHPSEVEPILVGLIELGADIVGLGLASVGRLRRHTPLQLEVDLAWVGAVVDNVPVLHDFIERHVGRRRADLLLGVTNSLLAGLAQGMTGPLVDVAHRSMELREAGAQRAVWQRAEPRLATTSWPAPLLVGPRPRPSPLPPGPVERYSDRAWVTSLGAFGVSLAMTGSLERSAAPLLDGLPKAARLGREAYAANASAILASHDVLVMDRRQLRLLDRVDCLVLDAEGLTPHLDDLVTATTRAGLMSVVPMRSPGDVDQGRFLVVPRDGLTDIIWDLQRDGHVVAVASSDPVILAGADVAVGLVQPGQRPPWGADLLAPPTPSSIHVLIAATALARKASRDAVRIALGGAALGALSVASGLRRSSSQRVMRTVNGASLLAMANGIRVSSGLTRLEPPTPRDLTRWHALQPDEVIERLASSRDGLTLQDWEARFEPPPPEPGWPSLLSRAVLREFDNPLTPILAAGAGISLATGALADAMLVVTVMGGNAAVGGLQRFRTDRSMASMYRHASQTVAAVRGGEHLEVPAGQLVVGDVILLRAGETVPADCRILEAHGIEVDEASLTGESATVVKHAAAVEASSVADRTSMLYAGTSLAVGEARAVVVATGRNTEARRGLAFVQADPPAAGVEARLESLTAMTAPLAIAGGATLAASGLLHGGTLPSVLGAGVSLAVAAVPEGLPLLATVAQLGAARRLAARGVLTRNPRAVEALGRTNVLCADKTGTLTEGRLVLAEVGDGVTATTIDDAQASHRKVLLAARRATPIRPGQRLPHPTDRAIAHGTAAAGVQRQDGAAFTVVHELPFEPARGYHAVLADTGIGRLLSVKGAPETVLDRCTSWDHPDGRVELDVATRISLHDHADTLARRGLRVLAVAHASRSGRTSITDQDVDGLILAGFVGLVDPIRPTAREAVAGLRRAGVDVVMITGDHPTTARGIGEKLGLITGPDQLMIGTELGVLDDEALDDRLSQITVFARVTPADKVRIVRALQRLGKTVAMTGDGANDAAAIRLAEVGIALGKHATTAAREAADLIVTEERIETLVDAIAEGRGLWSSVRDAVAVLVGGNLGEIAFTVLGAMTTGAAPINARQLLLVNVLTDVAPAMAIALRPPIARDIDALLREGPDASLGTALDSAIAWRAIGTASGATAAHLMARLSGGPSRAHTVSLVALVGAQLGQTLAAGVTDPRVLVASAGSLAALITIVQTPGLSQMAGSRPLGPVGWLLGLSGAGIGTTVGLLGPRMDRSNIAGRQVSQMSRKAGLVWDRAIGASHGRGP